LDSRGQTYGSALISMQSYCAKRETCCFDIKQKLNRYKLSEDEKSRIIDELINEKFIDEERYARAFVRDKFRFNKWGKIKIGYHLRAKGISDSIIQHGMQEIDTENYTEHLKLEIKKKISNQKTDVDKSKIIRTFQSKGFELDLILKAYDSVKNI
jgi:regulatory protein